MVTLALKITDKNGNTLAVASGEGFVDLVYSAEYKEGDKVELWISEKNIDVKLQVDDALGASIVYLTGNLYYDIPFGEKRISMSPKVFYGTKHYLYAELASKEEVYAYRNLALNPNDQHKDVTAFPHATANVETRGESVFAAKNAIDGVRANLSHGEWPYESWGINLNENAAMKVDFGREVELDKIVLYTRSDFPHDSWWTSATVTFSDGSKEVLTMEKSAGAHVFNIEKRKVTWVELSELIKADDASPFPALSQIECYGIVVR